VTNYGYFFTIVYNILSRAAVQYCLLGLLIQLMLVYGLNLVLAIDYLLKSF